MAGRGLHGTFLGLWVFAQVGSAGIARLWGIPAPIGPSLQGGGAPDP